MKKSTVILFGSKADPEVQRSINRIAITGRKVELAPRPSYDTGLGLCGNHLCHCKTVCCKQYEDSLVNETLMGKSF